MEEIEFASLNAMWTKGVDLVMRVFYQVMGMVRFVESDEKVYYRFDPRKEVEGEEVKIAPSTLSYEFNEDGNISVEVEVSEELAKMYPGALVSIDGKEYDLKKLDSAFVLVPGKEHRVSIMWVAGELVETFIIK